MGELKLFLDSGAYSAFAKKTKIDLNHYIDFIKNNDKYIEIYANLDVIGNAAATLKNQKIMEKAGLRPLPVFHVGSDVSYLKYYIRNYDYVAIGGVVSKLFDKKTIISLLDQYFSRYICDKDGTPKIKTHGFGITNIKFIMRYPWFSVDSTSWVIGARTGIIFVPMKKDGVYRYDLEPLKIPVSTKSPRTEKVDQHINNFSPNKKSEILYYIKEKGFSLKQLAADYKKRDQFNVLYFIDLENYINTHPKKYKSKTKKGFNLLL
jgi:hypothetical protein